jgi:hypothetical protein
MVILSLSSACVPSHGQAVQQIWHGHLQWGGVRCVCPVGVELWPQFSHSCTVAVNKSRIILVQLDTF